MGKKPRLFNTRAVSATLLVKVINQKRSLTAILPQAVAPLSEQDSAFIQTLCYTTLRWFPKLDYLTQSLLSKPLRTQDNDIYCLLLLGLCQLIELTTPVHAALSETVSATQVLKKSWAKGLINGVLRNYLRNEDSLKKKIANHEEANTAHPKWLLQTIQQYWPNHWQQIITANNTHPPLSLRINSLQGTKEHYLRELESHHIEAQILPYTHQGITLIKPYSVAALPGFHQGKVSVQDGAGQQAAVLLNIQPKQRILDACAAPGGKTCHILELNPTADLVALDIDQSRLNRIQENLTRLQLKAQLILGDATDTKLWWDGILFDRILLDAPCTSSGVIRRHPDIKVLRRKEDIHRLAILQECILNALWPLLAPGGLLLYCTCSIFPPENDEQILKFLTSHSDAKISPFTVTWGISQEVGQQLLTGIENFDGFYYARLEKCK
ncbi:16S rRNA (cytosine(967)-C(5))-methyltransferase RsmB [Candidatus Nitrosacidococcus sp. I8]|uniref:16S rRNA (cytosine(967)-C(5))-methyltransferase RsmB n=1 Tax=Candidatus Nitrosacidococcus sp. I8 TaxID=2942908 RepID=UPI00222633BD|nr:16S rRNA (cytosine(967)-C(5))-methyltransferase RsmB [Candidatus Nitrosacidococcus sp. I8]CAH9019636.1 Ribosomal RNA small subunit methyltransferase B [Candidatus Nitrosacidococcus sp. I8]